MANWLNEIEREAKALPKETRQKFLDLMYSGRSVGEAAEECGISFNAANGIMRLNITSTLILNRDSA